MSMLHLRIVSPANRTEPVLELLEEHDRVHHVACIRAVVRDRGGGDLITALVHHEVTDRVVEGLASLGPWADGMVSFTDVDLELFDRSPSSGDRDDDWDEGADVVVVEELRQRARSDARSSLGYVLSMVSAGVIASVGLLVDQPVLIVGAMAVSPDLARIQALNVGVVTRDPSLALRALRTLMLGLFVASLASAVTAAISRAGGLIAPSFSLADLDQVAFVTSPDLFSVIVASAAGVAGMLAFENERGGAAVGVAISVTTIPAASAIGVALAVTSMAELADAAAQLAVNIVCLVAAGGTTLALQLVARGADPVTRSRSPSRATGPSRGGRPGAPSGS